MQSGFGLIELLIVLTIIIIVSVFAAVSLFTFRGQSDLDGATAGTLDALRIARAKTLASENASSYGVYFESATYTLFAGRVFAPAALTNEPRALPQSVEIFSVQLSTSVPSIVFDRVTGNTSTTGTLSLRHTADPARSRTIRVESSGNAFVTATAVPELGTRITDTRHLHLDLGWSMQNATTLRLRFYDPPNPDVVNDVTMASYFNADRTRFSWEGDTNVYGANQHLRVHTHTLNSVNTILSVHRDRRYNTKTVGISIFDGGIEKYIVGYDAAGNAAVGIYGGTMTQQ